MRQYYVRLGRLVILTRRTGYRGRNGAKFWGGRGSIINEQDWAAYGLFWRFFWVYTTSKVGGGRR